MSYVYRNLIVSAAMAPLARQLTAAVAGPAGEGMFTVGLSPDGTGEPTHYISTGMIEDTMAELLDDAQVLHDAITVATPEGEPVPVTLAQCQALLDASDISEDLPEVAFARLGLGIVQDEPGT